MSGRSAGTPEDLLNLRAAVRAENDARADPRARAKDIHAQRHTLIPRAHEAVVRPNLAPGGFDPRQITGLVAWYDAKSLTGLAPGAAVGTWPDRSGLGHDLLQATGANQPLYEQLADGIFLRFDGVNDSMTATALFTVGQLVLTVHAVVRTIGAAAANARVWSNGVNNHNLFVSGTHPNAQFAYYNPVTNLGGNSANLTVATVRLESISTGTAWRNGVPVTFDPVDTGATADFIVGNDGASDFANIEVGELIVVGNAEPDWRRLAADRYLGNKWGIPVP